MSGVNFKITNTTYAALSMRDGDQFAKKFGGETGDDPDYFYVKVQLLSDASIVYQEDIYLADYRFEDNSQDYIEDDWVNFSYLSFDEFNTIKFQIFSSDTGAFGINTPLFFCIDDINTEYVVNSVTKLVVNNIKLFPNPTQNILNIQLENERTETLSIHDLYGRSIRTFQVIGQQVLDVSDLASGVYFVISESGSVSRFVKQ